MARSKSNRSATPRVRIELAARTDIGRRRKSNQDTFLVLDLDARARVTPSSSQCTLGALGTLLVVCDGMGGAAAGEVAAQMAIDSVADTLLQGPSEHDPADLQAAGRRLRAAVERASDEVFRCGANDSARAGMGTTLTAVLVRGAHAIVAQVGDSRAYVWRRQRLTQITRDQSLLNQLLDNGHISADDVPSFRHTNVLVGALGVRDHVDVELSKAELRLGDRILVCSDGLVGPCGDEVIESVLGHDGDMSTVAETLIELANAGGGPDNITAIVAEIVDGVPRPTDDDELRYERWEVGWEVLPPKPSPSTASDPKPKRDGAVEPLRTAMALVNGERPSDLWTGLLYTILSIALAGGLVLLAGGGH